MKKVIPVLIALVLIVIIGIATAGSMVFDKYSYSKETADLQEYFGISGDELAIVLQDEIIPEKARLVGGVCYFDLDTVHKYFNDWFYADTKEMVILYALPESVDKVVMESSATAQDGTKGLAFVEDETVYVALELVKKYTNFSADVYDGRVQVYTQWGEKRVVTVESDTEVRVKGGVKSPILKEVEEGEELEVLERMETWSKVKTQDAIIGYVENKRISEETVEQEKPVTDYTEPVFTTNQLEGKVCLGWHSIGGAGGNSTLESMVVNAKSMNVIAPTWFSLSDNEGSYESFASSDYVTRAHNMGLEVWGVLDDFNYNNVNNAGISVYEVLSSTSKRNRLISTLVQEAVAVGLDGINLDFERVTEDCGEHYAQFVRELSVQCRLNGLTFSVDNYVPFNFNEYLRRDVQGKVADYVIIMGYDEHWHGSGDPGSVASLGYVSNGIDKTLESVPKEKVVNALPFYSILWKTEGANVTDDYLTLNNTQDFLARVGQEGVWDEETQQLYVEWISGNTKYQLWAETEESIMVKLNVMRAKEIAGVAVWRLGYGTPAVWEMISAYVNS